MRGWRLACPEPTPSALHPSLSGLELHSEHLDPKLLSRLKQLQELDLSNNQLEVLPDNLGLSHLRVLHCCNNQLGDVTALCQFPKLEELSLEGNPFLTVSGFAQRPQAWASTLLLGLGSAALKPFFPHSPGQRQPESLLSPAQAAQGQWQRCFLHFLSGGEPEPGADHQSKETERCLGVWGRLAALRIERQAWTFVGH